MDICENDIKTETIRLHVTCKNFKDSINGFEAKLTNNYGIPISHAEFKQLISKCIGTPVITNGFETIRDFFKIIHLEVSPKMECDKYIKSTCTHMTFVDSKFNKLSKIKASDDSFNDNLMEISNNECGLRIVDKMNNNLPINSFGLVVEIEAIPNIHFKSARSRIFPIIVMMCIIITILKFIWVYEL